MPWLYALAARVLLFLDTDTSNVDGTMEKLLSSNFGERYLKATSKIRYSRLKLRDTYYPLRSSRIVRKE